MTLKALPKRLSELQVQEVNRRRYQWFCENGQVSGAFDRPLSIWAPRTGCTKSSATRMNADQCKGG